MSILECIGRTPLVRIYENLFVKIEGKNPGGSVKDRAALYMLREAGLERGSIVIEPTSGNLGISLAMLSAVLGYKAIIVMPRGMSAERERLIKAYGGDVVLTDGGMVGAIDYAMEHVKSTSGAFMPNQFNNPANVRAHIETTGPEIFRDTEGRVDILVAGVGSAGTITGTGKYLKSKKPTVKIVAVEPASSAVLSGGTAQRHGIQGIGAGFVPPLYDSSLVDEVASVSDSDAMEWARRLAREHGILCGISSGAAMCVAERMSKSTQKNVVAILPDGGERYISTGLFS